MSPVTSPEADRPRKEPFDGNHLLLMIGSKNKSLTPDSRPAFRLKDKGRRTPRPTALRAPTIDPSLPFHRARWLVRDVEQHGLDAVQPHELLSQPVQELLRELSEPRGHEVRRVDRP